eukprot:TRINITY_DN9508_c2_g1_i1.p1 TRINITY_DN9508_c2_g1~~TRINITY_DN9508_c2_g1_i1.p1  ORF type:complete len:261 (-),score=28.01 TRINITY_DN9508_c2_g1_i1:503-1285(-)
MMVACVGADDFGSGTIANFRARGVLCDHVRSCEGVSSGVATIYVDAAGENCIAIVAGANDKLSREDVLGAREAMGGFSLMLCQNEIPIDMTEFALKIAKEAGLTTAFNAAPAPQKPLSHGFLSHVDYLCANQTELATISGKTVANTQDAISAASELAQATSTVVVVTLGKDGCMAIVPGEDEAEVIRCAAVKLDAKLVVDTVGAGDCWLGAFANSLDQGLSLRSAMTIANRVAALSVQRHGTQSSYSRRSEIDQSVFACE